jgi:protein phosphatase
MRGPARAASLVLQGFRPLLELDRMYCEEIGRTIAIPTFDEEVILQVCEGARKVFERSDIVMDLHAPFYIVGDIHGNIFDLLRIFILAGSPPRSRFLFLGDYVDRGEYSVEVVTLLFAFLLAYPDHVFLLRGNHEFETMNTAYGFAAEIMSQYQSRALYETFNSVFHWMPLVAILDDQIFCVHGGISPHAKSLAQLRKIKRPLASYDAEFVADLVWSDPCHECKTCDESARGLGVQFGVKPLQEFLSVLKMKQMLRAHQCVATGISGFGGDLLYTIFSCSHYEGQGNRCGLLFVDVHLQLEMFSLPPLDPIPKADARTERCARAGADDQMQISDSLAVSTKLLDIGAIRSKSLLVRAQRGPNRKESLLEKYERFPPAASARAPSGGRIKPSGSAAWSPKQLQRAVSGDIAHPLPPLGEETS